MIDEMRSFLNRVAPTVELGCDTNIRKLLENFKTLFYSQGMLSSIVTNRPVDKEGDFLPWYTYSAIDYFNQLDFSQCKVIEFGSGYSTLYWSEKAGLVESIERDKDWYQEVLKKVSRGNVDLKFFDEKEAYFDYIGIIKKNEYDVIIVDGKDRYETMINLTQALKKGGILIFDNSDWYPASCCYLRDQGFSQVDFSGFGPINNYTWCTSVFFKGDIAIPHYENLNFIGRREVVKDDDCQG